MMNVWWLWYLKYSDEAWTKRVREHVESDFEMFSDLDVLIKDDLDDLGVLDVDNSLSISAKQMSGLNP